MSERESRRPPGGRPMRPSVGVVLAAGKGTRMRSALPKVLHRVGGRPMLAWVLDAVRQAGCERILVVVGHEAERVRRELAADDVVFVLQEEQLGTGHAVAQVESEVPGDATLVVVSGDVPLVSAETLRRLERAAADGWGAMAVATLERPASLGRVVAGASGDLERIVEVADATAEELAIRRVNAGLYALPAPAIFARLRELVPDNAKGELYLTDALTGAAARDERVALVELGDPSEAWGANTRAELAALHRELVGRKTRELMESGVTLLDPEAVTVESGVAVGRDTVVHPGVSLLGATAIGERCEVHSGAWLRDTVLGDGCEVLPSSVLDGAVVGAGCRIGPFARLRPGAVLGDGARAGNFVEIKQARIGAGAKVNHLAYVGDATVGAGANLGAGVVTCNYDGAEKHRTEVGERAFVGSGTLLVAPVAVGDDATTAAGSVITRDVPAQALGVERSRQRNLEGWSGRRRKRRPAED